MFGTVLRFIKFNNFDTQHLNGPRCLFILFCCTTRCIFDPLRVFEPGFNMDKYGMHVHAYIFCVYVCVQVGRYMVYCIAYSDVLICTQVYGFYEECKRKYGSVNVQVYGINVLRYLTTYLSLSPIIADKIFCVHSGLSLPINILDQVTWSHREVHK